MTFICGVKLSFLAFRHLGLFILSVGYIRYGRLYSYMADKPCRVVIFRPCHTLRYFSQKFSGMNIANFVSMTTEGRERYLSLMWPGGVVVRALETCDSKGSITDLALSGNNLGQVVHTRVPLSAAE